LSATVAPANATNKTVTWSSNNTDVATVDNTGLVTGISAGSVIVTATTADGNHTVACTITVQTQAISVSGINLSKTAVSIILNDTEELSATISPSNATNKTVTWSSSNPAVATVNSSGLVKGVSVGSATITATTSDGNYTATCAVTVYAASNDATLSSLTVSIGQLSPAFNSATTSYTVNVSNSITSINVTGTANQSAATVSGNVTDKALIAGNNIVSISVTAEDGTTKTYTVTIVRAATIQETEANLVGLSANGKDIDVTEKNLEYIAACDETLIALDIEVSPYATVNINGVEYVGQDIQLISDVTTANIQVVSETGSSVQNYTLKVTKAIDESNLYYQRWSDVLAINRNPSTNGGYNIENFRWYRKDGSLIGTTGYISIQGSASDYYAEIQVSNNWRRVCRTTSDTRGISGIRIYPNPVSHGETVKVKLSEDFVGGYLNIFSITGSLTKSNLPLPTSDNSIDVRDLPTGIYLFKVTGKSGNSETVKIVIE